MGAFAGWDAADGGEGNGEAGAVGSIAGAAALAAGLQEAVASHTIAGNVRQVGIAAYRFCRDLWSLASRNTLEIEQRLHRQRRTSSLNIRKERFPTSSVSFIASRSSILTCSTSSQQHGVSPAGQ